MPRDPVRPALVGALAILAALAVLGCGRPTPTADAPAPDPGTPVADERSEVQRDRARDQSVTRIEELIEGRGAGVQVIRRPDGSIALRIRGFSSPTGQNDPLLVIDGMQIGPAQVGSALLSLHPGDVVRIDVLKDAASTAFYGMRGGNGVVVITTRRR